jgi:hypothetical protein
MEIEIVVEVEIEIEIEIEIEKFPCGFILGAIIWVFI